ncbi:MAG: STAS domain-containing protein [Isosphaeraceae bacterium]|nr:STAS domain-containing protein [Isosphaeraceae bacterium]
MPLNIRYEGDIAILSNIGRSMNDPRYVDAGREVTDLLDEGLRKFVIELRGVRETGSPLLGLLMTMTRQIRQRGGEVVLASLSRGMEQFLAEMQMEEFWDTFRSVEEAKESLD